MSPASQTGEQRGVALEGDMHDVDACGSFQHFHRQMLRIANAAGAEVQRAGLRLRAFDENP